MGTVHKFTLVDRLRKGSRAHRSVYKTLANYIDNEDDEHDEISDIVDAIFEELWLDGFKIVPRDDGGRAA